MSFKCGCKNVKVKSEKWMSGIRHAGNENGDCCGLMDGGIAVIFVFGFMLWVCFALCYFFNRLVDRFD